MPAGQVRSVSRREKNVRRRKRKAREEAVAISTAEAPGTHHPIAWYSELKRRERSAFWACIGGWILDAMDVQMFSFAIPAIIAAFAITNADAGVIGTATLLPPPLAGWFPGPPSDRLLPRPPPHQP